MSCTRTGLHKIALEASPYYHCSRCLRRALLKAEFLALLVPFPCNLQAAPGVGCIEEMMRGRRFMVLRVVFSGFGDFHMWKKVAFCIWGLAALGGCIWMPNTQNIRNIEIIPYKSSSIEGHYYLDYRGKDYAINSYVVRFSDQGWALKKSARHYLSGTVYECGSATSESYIYGEGEVNLGPIKNYSYLYVGGKELDVIEASKTMGEHNQHDIANVVYEYPFTVLGETDGELCLLLKGVTMWPLVGFRTKKRLGSLPGPGLRTGK